MSFDYKRWKQLQYRAANDTPKTAVDCPTAIFLVATIWVAVGIIHLVAVLVIALKLGKIGGLTGLVFLGLVHLFCGLRTLSGTAPGTIRSGIFSLVYGFVWVMVAGVGAKTGTNPNAPLIALGLGAVGGALLLAGCLAIIASGSYRQWREAN